MHKVQELVRLHRKGVGAREVARLLRISPNTERAWRRKLDALGLLKGELDELPDIECLNEAVPPKRPPQQTSSVNDVEEKIRALWERGASPKAIHDRLRLDDPQFHGSYYAVKRQCARFGRQRAPVAEDVAIPVVTAAGEVAQVDFGYAGRMHDPVADNVRRAWVFVMVLSHSRHMFAKCVFTQDMATWQQLHVEAFAFFGGVPEVVVPDNLKAAVIRASFGIDGDAKLNRSYIEVARHYDFKVDPAPPRQPKKKGKVERQVQYVKRNALATLPESITVDEANRDLHRWLLEIAGQRLHSATGRKPMELFAEVEQRCLRSLPEHPFVPVVWHRAKVQRDSHIVFKQRLYSVPWKYLGERAWVRATPEWLYIYVDNERVAEHARKDGHGRTTRDAHLPENRRDLRHRGRSWWKHRAAAIGPETEALLVDIFADESVVYPVRRVQYIVSHLESFPRDRAEGAARRARYFGVHHLGGVRNILKQALDREPLPESLPFPDSRPTYRFTRPIREMLAHHQEENHEYH